MRNRAGLVAEFILSIIAMDLVHDFIRAVCVSMIRRRGKRFWLLLSLKRTGITLWYKKMAAARPSLESRRSSQRSVTEAEVVREPLLCR